MKTKAFLLAFMLGVASFVGCSSDDGNDDKPQPSIPTTYDVAYTLNVSDDFFSAGTVLVSYKDGDGEDQSEILEKSDMPYMVTLEGLDEDDLIYFDVAFGKQDITVDDLTQDKYKIAFDAAYAVESSNGSGKGNSIANSSMDVAKDHVLGYLDRLMEHEYGVAEKKISDLF